MLKGWLRGEDCGGVEMPSAGDCGMGWRVVSRRGLCCGNVVRGRQGLCRWWKFDGGGYLLISIGRVYGSSAGRYRHRRVHSVLDCDIELAR